MSDSIGVYVHIPYCKSKCAYCDFFSGKGNEEEFSRYTNELIDKIYYWGKVCERQASSLYIGGGTPSVLGAERICEIISAVKTSFNIADNAEFTVELNPDTGKNLDFARLKDVGVNRLSVGMQSAVQNELEKLGRIHTVKDVIKTVVRAEESGIDNISLDLMTGIPLQTADSLKYSMDFCADLGIKHISSYILKIEEGTPFFNQRRSLCLPDENAQAEMYLLTVGHLERLGYGQYEISNFSKSGFESRHNINYWRCGEYIGIGPSAHSFYNGKRFYYGRSFDGFRKNTVISDGDGGSAEEWLMLALRLKRGVIFEEFEKCFGVPLPSKLVDKAEFYGKNGFMETDSERICFTPEGFLVSNTIIADLLNYL